LDDLVLMITLWGGRRASGNFKPHMREVCPHTGFGEGRGCDQALGVEDCNRDRPGT